MERMKLFDAHARSCRALRDHTHCTHHPSEQRRLLRVGERCVGLNGHASRHLYAACAVFVRKKQHTRRLAIPSTPAAAGGSVKRGKS